MIDSKTVIYPTKNNHAFTIIELLIVIVVIGILVAISVVSYLGIQSRARDAVNETNISGIFKSVEMHKAQKNIYPDFLYSETWGHLGWTTTNGTPASMYRNPAAPDWLPSSFVLNAYYYDYSNDPPTLGYVPFDNWDYTIEVAEEVPEGFNDWSEFYDSAYTAYSSYQNDHPFDGTTDEEWDVYLSAFAEMYPTYACYVNDECESGKHEVKKEWLYFIDPLFKVANDYVCINYRPSSYPESWSGVTGFRIRYFNQTTKTWKEMRTGSGEVGRFISCLM